MADVDAIVAALLAHSGALSPALENEIRRYLTSARIEVDARARESHERATVLERQRIRASSDEFARAQGYRDWEDYQRRSPL